MDIIDALSMVWDLTLLTTPNKHFSHTLSKDGAIDEMSGVLSRWVTLMGKVYADPESIRRC